jgi:hypothetical protein
MRSRTGTGINFAYEHDVEAIAAIATTHPGAAQAHRRASLARLADPRGPEPNPSEQTVQNTSDSSE